jgi:hypothetical protein
VRNFFRFGCHINGACCASSKEHCCSHCGVVWAGRKAVTCACSTGEVQRQLMLHSIHEDGPAAAHSLQPPAPTPLENRSTSGRLLSTSGSLLAFASSGCAQAGAGGLANLPACQRTPRQTGNWDRATHNFTPLDLSSVAAALACAAGTSAGTHHAAADVAKHPKATRDEKSMRQVCAPEKHSASSFVDCMFHF